MDPKAKRQKLTTLEIAASPSLITKVDVEEAMKKQNDVAMFLMEKVISAIARNSNFVFSPASINTVLTMVAASSDNKTLKSIIFSILRSSSIDELNAVFSQIATIVLVDGSTNGGPKISSVNGVWMEHSLPDNPLLKDLFENFFKAAYDQVDFRFKGEKMRKKINKWASKHTNGLIKDLLPRGSIKTDTDWVYGNALYFKGAWAHKFPKSLTRDEEFHLLNNNTVTVPFMATSKMQYVSDYVDFKVLKLPFRECGDINLQFSMFLYLPESMDGLDSLMKRISSTPGFLDSHIPTKKVRISNFKIPKFKVEFGFEASSVFNELKLTEVSLYHKALVEIDEDGAEAAASTVSVLGAGSARRNFGKIIDFVADHPFLFLIRHDQTGTVLFVGQIFDPSNSA